MKPAAELIAEIRKWNDAADESRELADRVERALNWHRNNGHGYCWGCDDEEWPCPTASLLNGILAYDEIDHYSVWK